MTGRDVDPGTPGGKAGASPLRVAVQLAATVLVTWLIVDRLGVGLEDALSLGAALPEPAIVPLAASVLVLLWAFFLSAWLWGRMVGELGARSPGGWVSGRIVFTSNLARYLPGKVWQLAGLATLARRAGIPATVATAAGVLGQTFSLAAAGILAVPALFGVTGATGAWGALVLGVLAVVVTVTSIPSVLRHVLAALYRLAGIPRDQVPETGILFGPRWLGWYLFNWALYTLAFVLFARGLGWDVAGSSLASAFAAAYLMGYVVFFAPAGIGVREGLLVALLRPEMGDASVAVAVLARVWMTAVEVIPAGGFAFWEVLRPPGADVPESASGGAG